jgi:hypothetical protein
LGTNTTMYRMYLLRYKYNHVQNILT